MNPIKALSLLITFTFLITSSVTTAPLESEERSDTTTIATDITTTTTSTISLTTTQDDSNESMSEKKSNDIGSTELVDFTSYKNTSTFTCYGRRTGYYADVKLECRIYHFCTQMENLGGISYQRMSYLCLENSFFDQKDLNCVKQSDLKVKCDKAEAEYDSSNKQFDTREESQPSMSDNLAANIMMNPITRFIAG